MEFLTVKAQELADVAKVGLVLSKSNIELLTEARDALDAVLIAPAPEDEKTSALDGSGKTDEPSQAGQEPAVDEEPDGVKSAAQVPDGAPRRALAVALLTTLSN